ncbi:MAG: universal stress protein [Deltaproteobacteria bacterium]|nr:universal stress protein [Deltaproteobacteria bacterium]
MKIIIAVDGSQHSLDACKLVSHMPLTHKSIVTLVGVAQVIEYPATVKGSAREAIDEFNEEVLKNTQKLVKEAQSFLKKEGLAAEAKILRGYPVKELCRFAETEKADLIAIGSRGLNPIKRQFLGSVSDGIIRHAPCSVLLFRPYKNRSLYDRKPEEKLDIVIGYDDSISSKEACAFVKKLDFKAIKKIDLLTALQLNFYYGMSYTLTALEYWPKQKASIEESLLAMKQSFEKLEDAPEVNFEVIGEAKDAAHELNDYALKHHKDLIVVGTKGKGAFDRLVLGSVSTKLAHNAEVPLLIVRG